MFGPVETADGYVMVAIASEKTFQSLVKAAGHPEWISDPRFAKYADRRDNWEDLMEGVETWSRTLTTAQCLAALNEQRRSQFGLSHRRRGVGRSAARASRRAGRGGGRRRHVQGDEPAVPDVGGQCLGGKARGDAGRTHRGAISGRAAFPKTKSRPSPANRRASGADGGAYRSHGRGAVSTAADSWQGRLKIKNHAGEKR